MAKNSRICERGCLEKCGAGPAPNILFVWAEVRAHFASEKVFKDTLALLGVRFEGISEEAAALAGRLWRAHRAKSRRGRPRVIPDFLIGAHARLQADQLLTRDRGFYRRYFSGLRVVDPSGRT